MARLQSILALIAVALLASGAAATQNDCLGGCASSHPSFEPVCCDGRMWYNACYMLCQAPNITLYERCPSPSPSPAPSPSPSRPPCDPLTYPYVNQTYHCQSDCRTYTLVDVNAGCMPNWAGARAYCESRGLELAPWDTDASNGAWVLARHSGRGLRWRPGMAACFGSGHRLCAPAPTFRTSPYSPLLGARLLPPSLDLQAPCTRCALPTATPAGRLVACPMGCARS